MFDEGYNILYSQGDYETNLAWARAGTLLFLILLAGVTYAWGRRYFSEGVGILAVVLLLTLPPILGHAGLATLDVACAATVTLALYQLLRFIDESTPRRAAILGFALGLAALTKFSSIPFLAVCIVPVLAWRARKISWRLVAITAAVTFLVVWGGYGFEIKPLEPQYGPHPKIDRALQHTPMLARAFDAALNTPIPATDFFLGIRDVWRHNDLGHDSFLFGEFRRTGWWYFFPVVLAVKTPIGFLALALAGLWITLRQGRTLPRPQSLTALFFIAIFLFSLTSRIDLGVRHILSVYPLLALLAAHVVIRACQASPKAAIAPVALVVFALAESASAHPDYLAHFNAFAGTHPETILCESDLDWGQDLKRLSTRLRELHADHVTISYFGSSPLDKAGLPPYRLLGVEDLVPGYVAVSVRFLNLEHARNGALGRFRNHRPIERIGRSIDLYYLDTLP
jgi:4-amino-4-deoxy-L-arabinose transferase-like glycosyltransferase